MNIKICGLREQKNVAEISLLHPEWMGFIFYPPSPRYFFDAETTADLHSIDKSIKKTGVFVNEEVDIILSLAYELDLQYVQLHGNESPEYCRVINEKGIKIINAFPVETEDDIQHTDEYAPYVDSFLFDTKGKQAGGTGIRFNWELLSGKRFKKPFLLSGGIGPEHAGELKQFHHPDLAGIDINSRFEIRPGLKDVSRIHTFMQQLS